MDNPTIILRPFRAEDADPLWSAVQNPLFNKLTGTHATFTRQQIEAYVTKQIANDNYSANSGRGWGERIRVLSPVADDGFCRDAS